MSDFIDPHALLALVADVRVRGIAPPEEAILHEPRLLVSVSDPGQPPVDRNTYEIRLQRWRDGAGPVLHGMEEFVAALRACVEPTRVLSVRGPRTNYTYLVDEGVTRVIAAVAVDVPEDGEVSGATEGA